MIRPRIRWIVSAALLVIASAAAASTPTARGAAPELLITNATQARYNTAVGTLLDKTQPQFPATANTAGPTLSSPSAPNLARAASVLGKWLANPPVLSGSWSGPTTIPTTWAVGTENAIVYELDGGTGGLKGVTASIGVDNGVYVWVNGQYKFGALAPGGAPPGEYQIPIGDLPAGKNYLQVLREDHGGFTGWTITVSGTRAAGTWPALPDALVPLASVSNGCGGGPAGNDKKYGDDSDYVNSEIPFADEFKWERAKKYHVDFREACKLHDAGYSHAKVRDPLHGNEIVDFFGWSKAQIDTKFLKDMILICNQQITDPKATVALRNCKQNGGFHLTSGAQSRYDLVAATTYTQYLGLGFYQEAPKLSGSWTVPGSAVFSAFAITQNQRLVTVTWTGGTAQPDTTYEFRGTVISHDNDSAVTGFYVKTVNGVAATPKAMRLLWSPKKPDELQVSSSTAGGFTITR